jgi:hypothetical protein
MGALLPGVLEEERSLYGVYTPGVFLSAPLSTLPSEPRPLHAPIPPLSTYLLAALEEPNACRAAAGLGL